MELNALPVVQKVTTLILLRGYAKLVKKNGKFLKCFKIFLVNIIGFISKTCTSFDVCQSCKTGNYLYKNSCVSDCP